MIKALIILHGEGPVLQNPREHGSALPGTEKMAGTFAKRRFAAKKKHVAERRFFFTYVLSKHVIKGYEAEMGAPFCQ